MTVVLRWVGEQLRVVGSVLDVPIWRLSDDPPNVRVGVDLGGFVVTAMAADHDQAAEQLRQVVGGWVARRPSSLVRGLLEVVKEQLRVEPGRRPAVLGHERRDLVVARNVFEVLGGFVEEAEQVLVTKEAASQMWRLTTLRALGLSESHDATDEELRQALHERLREGEAALRELAREDVEHSSSPLKLDSEKTEHGPTGPCTGQTDETNKPGAIK